MRRFHDKDYHWLGASQLLLEGGKPCVITKGDWKRVGGFHPPPTKRGDNEAVVCCLTCLSNVIQKRLPSHVLPKLKWPKPETGLLHKLLLSVDDVELVVLQDLDGALTSEGPFAHTSFPVLVCF